MVCTRPDIAHVVRVVSRFLLNPGNEHWEGVKWILRYLKGTSKMHLSFRRSNLTLQGFSDVDLKVIWMVERAQQVTFLHWVV